MHKFMLVVMLALAAACNPASPELYNLAIDQFSLPDACYTSGGRTVPTSRTTAEPPKFLQVSVWDGSSGEAYMTVESSAISQSMGAAESVSIGGMLTGKKGSGGWTFDSETVTTQTMGSAVLTTDKKVSLTFDRGLAFKGKGALSSSTSCTGTGCPTNGDPSCSVDLTVHGTQIEVTYQKAP